MIGDHEFVIDDEEKVRYWAMEEMMGDGWDDDGEEEGQIESITTDEVIIGVAIWNTGV